MTVYAPRLRFLLDPVYIQVANLSGSSTYNKYRTVAQELIKRKHFVYWCVPDAKYTPHELEDNPRIGIVRTKAIQDQFVADGLVTDAFFNLFNRVAGQYHIDCLVTSRTGLALYYKRLLEAPRFHDNERNYTDKAYGLPVVVLEEFPQTRKRQHSGKAYWLQQCQGYLSADKTIFLSSHNREEVVEEMSDWFRTSIVSDWVKRTQIIGSGIQCTELDKYVNDDRWEVEKGFNVISIGRLFGEAQIEYLPWFDYLYRSGQSDTTLTISLSGTLSGPMRAKLEKIGFDTQNNFGRQFKVIENNTRGNFLKMLKKFHAFIVPVTHLDHPTAIFEALYYGVPGIIPVSDYQQTYFRNYPFVVEPKKKEQFLATLLWIKEHPKEARDKVKHWREHLRKNHDSVANVCNIVNVCEEASRSHINRFKTSAGVVNLLKELKGRSYKWEDIVAYLRNNGHLGVSVGDMDIRTTFTYARGAIHHSMFLAGFVDECSGPDERFIRRDIFERRNIKRRVGKKRAKKVA